MKSKKRSNRVEGWLLMFAFMVITSLMTGGCNSSGCTDNRSSIPLAGFYSIGDLRSIRLDGVDIGGVDAPNDSLMLTHGTPASMVYMPLRQTATTADYFIRYRYEELDDPALYDTIYFTYTTIPYFQSEECGAMMRYRITKLTHTEHLLDSVGLVPTDSIITNADTENIRLYFRTQSIDGK